MLQQLLLMYVFKVDRPYISQLTQGAEVAIVMAVTLILGYMAWIVMREIYVRLAIWAEEHDEGVHLLFVKCLAGAILFNMP